MAAFGNRVWNAAFSETVFPAPGTLSRLRIFLENAVGPGESRTFTLRINGSDTALTVTIPAGAIEGEDLTNSVSVVAGDRVQLQQTVVGVTSNYAAWSMRWVPTTEDYTVMCLTTDTTKLASGAASSQHLVPSGCQHGPLATTSDIGQRVYFPTGGTLRSMYVKLSAAPGTISGRTRTFTLVKNGTDTALQVVIDGNTTTGNDTTNP